ncbi:hypothetical protein ONZ45_g8917 [Pleurotus djamor]|nr:hypothetical protein ONZ45_g8917 [Pleurotus djamor]
MTIIFVRHGWVNHSEVVSIGHDDAIQTLKTCIEETTGVQHDKQLILLDGVELEDASLLVDGTTVVCLHLEELTFENTDGCSSTLLAPLNVPINDILEEIRSTDAGRPYHGYRILLYRENNVLERLRDGRTLEFYNITTSCKLILRRGPSLGRSLLSVPYVPSIVRKLNLWSKKHDSPRRDAAKATARIAWDGIIPGPCHGLPLEKGVVVYVLYMVSYDWCYGVLKHDPTTAGFFPRAHVTCDRSEPMFDFGEDDDEAIDIPPFPFAPKQVASIFQSYTPQEEESQTKAAPAIPTDTPSFRIYLGDKGRSYVTLQLALTRLATESDGPSRLDVKVIPNLITPRRITTLILDLRFPGHQVVGASPVNYTGENSQSTITAVSRRLVSLSVGGSPSGVSISLSVSGETGTTIEAERVTRQEISTVWEDGGSVRWTLTEDSGLGGRHGAPCDQPLSVTSKFHPGLIDYHCEVRHASNLDEESKSVIGQGFLRCRRLL